MVFYAVIGLTAGEQAPLAFRSSGPYDARAEAEAAARFGGATDLAFTYAAVETQNEDEAIRLVATSYVRDQGLSPQSLPREASVTKFENSVAIQFLTVLADAKTQFFDSFSLYMRGRSILRSNAELVLISGEIPTSGC